MELEEGDIILCEVDRIVGTTVFVKILPEKKIEGSLSFSEVAPGRIRNIRSYVVPKKKIVCKVLRISGKSIELSLRRVNQEERKQILEKFKQERSYKNMLKSILGKEKSEKVLEKISEKEDIVNFFEEAKEDTSRLNKIFDKKEAEKITEILESQKPKKAAVKKEIELKSSNPNGLEEIKKVFKNAGKEIEIKYISGGKYSLKTESEDLKKADNFLKEFLEEVEKKAKKSNMEFSILKK